MKNLFFALVFMLVGTFAFASVININDSVSGFDYDFGNCTYTINTTVTYPNGSSFTYSNTYTTTANSYSHCLQKARDHAAFLNAIQ